MSQLPDATLLKNITIPGAHDSGSTLGGFGDYARCQNLSIGVQLNLGVRYLDIRCYPDGEILPIYHGLYFQEITFGDVLAQIGDFFAENPKETVIMRMQQENGGDSATYKKILRDTYIGKECWRGLFYQATSFPNLGAARGKIVLVTGLPYIDNTVWWSDAELKKQDESEVGLDAKKKAISDHVNAALSNPTGFYINHISRQWDLLHDPEWYSQQLNPYLLELLRKLRGQYPTASARPRLGVIAFDFVNKSLCQDVIAWNFLDGSGSY
ncbi:phosphatidylinositol-specific phospholipase C domain-containing protein [Streptomyces sp. NPDC005533]|uniref:phosphatidylinositol-specific phospholipase C domain-containing protein n=1 Tax=Streptomyces sp. NPDC005533 TaxID=3364723 RepID=UPI0036B1B712